MMTRSSRVMLCVFAFAPLATACGAGTPPTMQGRSGMLSKTAIAQKCEEAAKGHDRPFVIEWDATDLASFEALAHRDTVVVRYEGCDIQVLDRCSDAAAAGHFGAYGQPEFTSGTVQGFDIGNEGELYAKLPLGAASLSGKVSAGENLHLKYFVSGVATSSRDALYSTDLAKIPGCAGATHFVWGYNLGAFELNSGAHNAEEAHAGFGNIGAGGSAGHQESSLANGGSMESCSTNDQRSCRVPIRLVLRAITDGDNPSKGAGGQTIMVGGQAMTTGQIQADPHFFDNTPMGQGNKMAEEARKRDEQGDGQGCVDLLDKAFNLNPQLATFNGRTHASCQMKAGHCDLGKTELKQDIAKQDPNRNKTDDQITEEVNAVANRECPAATASTPAEYILRAGHEMEAAKKANDGKRCSAIADKVESKFAQLQKTPDDMQANGRARIIMSEATECVAASISCDAGAKMNRRAYRISIGPKMKDEMVDKISTQQWETLTKLGRVKCQ
ncbi:MAG: hypothetical protein ABI183_02045 [Polyangiaceae bacterium]